MSTPMIQAAVTMNQLQNKMDLIGNNMANSQTTGYKGRQAEFSSLLIQNVNNMTDPANMQGRLTPDGIRVGSGAMLGSTNIDLTPGSIKETDRALDMALLADNHFFQIQVTENDIEETRYTRDGTFYLSPVNDNQDVMLTTGDGNPVMGQNGPIVIAEGFDSIEVQPNGQIAVSLGAQTEIAGELAVVEMMRPRLLEVSGENALRMPDVAELGFNPEEIIQDVVPNTDLMRSGVLENSNVDISKQMTDLITAQRAYQLNAQTISTGDQMMGLINQLR
ncbi:flagellar hook-basal body protein [Virgibacillus sp. NKC19-16]|uniref:flagellar hook-basal body protein n=1 Tax=Virgibacillus salidurans TaxID=2831673 RepID=UPI001F2CE3BF|nr:flagellar hook-basal body protein [Virgibacillus sp. NKC19-16]UJL45960.1 flagellar hook-basal body protein [Virgibacillus sp. NKC19-16]